MKHKPKNQICITDQNAEERIRNAMHTIIHGWNEWDASASQNAQIEQNSEAYDREMEDQIGAVLTGLVFDEDIKSHGDMLRTRDIERERDACADTMEQEHVRCLALEAALRLIATHENTDVAKLALNPRMACRRCGAAPECDVAFDRYNLGTVPKVDCLATK